MTVRIEEILKIKAGAAKAFACENLRQCKAGQTQAHYVGKFLRDKMPDDIARYKTSIDVGTVTLIVQAVPKNQAS